MGGLLQLLDDLFSCSDPRMPSVGRKKERFVGERIAAESTPKFFKAVLHDFHHRTARAKRAHRAAMIHPSGGSASASLLIHNDMVFSFHVHRMILT